MRPARAGRDGSSAVAVRPSVSSAKRSQPTTPQAGEFERQVARQPEMPNQVHGDVARARSQVVKVLCGLRESLNRKRGMVRCGVPQPIEPAKSRRPRTIERDPFHPDHENDPIRLRRCRRTLAPGSGRKGVPGRSSAQPSHGGAPLGTHGGHRALRAGAQRLRQCLPPPARLKREVAQSPVLTLVLVLLGRSGVEGEVHRDAPRRPRKQGLLLGSRSSFTKGSRPLRPGQG